MECAVKRFQESQREIEQCRIFSLKYIFDESHLSIRTWGMVGWCDGAG